MVGVRLCSSGACTSVKLAEPRLSLRVGCSILFETSHILALSKVRYMGVMTRDEISRARQTPSHRQLMHIGIALPTQPQKSLSFAPVICLCRLEI